jgi:hypothetical protein
MSDIFIREMVYPTREAELKQKNLFLSITDLTYNDGAQYRAYLDTVDTWFNSEKPDQMQLKLSGIHFKIQTTASAKQAERPKGGWIYLFVNGRLWREIMINEHGKYVDVNLEKFNGLPDGQRPAKCLPRSDIVVPVSYEGTPYKLEAAFSEQQWSWNRIEPLGGWDTVDTRNREPTKNPERALRCTELDYFRILSRAIPTSKAPKTSNRLFPIALDKQPKRDKDTAVHNKGLNLFFQKTGDWWYHFETQLDLL